MVSVDVSYLLSTASITFAPVIAYLSYVAQKANQKCESGVAGLRFRVRDLSDRLISGALGVTSDRECMSKIIREGAVQLNILREAAEYQCPDMMGYTLRELSLRGFLIFGFSLFMWFTASNLSSSALVFLFFYTLALYDIYNYIQKKNSEHEAMLEKAMVAGEQLEGLIKNIEERVCGI